MDDTLIHKGLREQLVEEIRSKGITDENVLNALRKIPRHLFFFDRSMEKFAYIDKAFPIESGQTISQPYTVALQTHLLSIEKNDKVLEIGTGSGYQAAVLTAMGAQVYTIERQQEIYVRTKALLSSFHLPITTFYGDGYKGLPQLAPFDKVILTAAAPYIPRPLLEQMKIGGILVAPVENGEQQEMIRIKKISDTEFEQTRHGICAFVPMLKGIC